MTAGFLKNILSGLLLFVGITVSGQQKTDSSFIKNMQREFKGNKQAITNDLQQIKDLPSSAGRQMLNNEKQSIKSLTHPGIIDSIKNKVKLLQGGKPFSLNQFRAFSDYNLFKDTSGIGSGMYRQSEGMLQYDLAVDFSILNIPFSFSADGMNGFYQMHNPSFDRFYKANFDPWKYRELLQNQVLQKIKPEVVLEQIQKRIDKIKFSYQDALFNEVSNIQKDFKQKFRSDIKLPDNFQDLDINDVSTLRRKIFQDLSSEKYQEDLLRYQQIVNTHSIPDNKKDSIATQTFARIKKYEAADKIYSRIIEWKQRFNENKTVQELRSHLPFTPEKFKSYLSKPGNLENVIKQHGDLKSIQSLFMNITKLDLGHAPVQNGELNLQNVMNTGINSEFKSNNKSIGIIQGANNNNVNNWLNAGLNSIVTNEYSRLSGFSIGSGKQSTTEQLLTINFFNFRNTPNHFDELSFLRSSYLPTAPHKDAVITWHSGYRLGRLHQVDLDVSKSFGSYQNMLSKDSASSPANAFASLNNGGGTSNLAAVLHYNGEAFNTPVQFTFKKVGLGYSNPGNVFLRRGETQAGLNISRKFLKGKLNLKYQADYRNQSFDPAKDYVYTTFTNKLQAGYRIRKNNRINLSYQRSDYRSKMYSEPVTNGLSDRLQLDGSYQLYLHGKKIMNYIVLNRQNMKLPVYAGNSYSSKSFLLTHTSSLVVGKNLLSVSLMSNYSTNKEYYFNTGFTNAEFNYNYALSEKFRLGSSMGYYSNTGWNRQLGGRQQLSLQFNKLDIDFDINYKKAIKTYRPELANQLFVTSSVHYQF